MNLNIDIDIDRVSTGDWTTRARSFQYGSDGCGNYQRWSICS